MTRADIERTTLERVREALEVNPVEAEERIVLVAGAPVFALSRLTVRQLQTLNRLLFTIILEAR